MNNIDIIQFDNINEIESSDDETSEIIEQITDDMYTNYNTRYENIIEEGARTEAGSGAYVGASVTEAPIKILTAVSRTAGFKRAWWTAPRL
jgi:hypothetical protein